MSRMIDGDRDYDRKIRILFLLHLLNCNPQGLTIEAIASHCRVSRRTAYRDLDGLEAEFGAKFRKEGSRFILLPGTVLPPVLFTMPEAMAIFMASRLLLQQSSVYNHDIETTFTKLGSVVTPRLREEIMRTLRWMQRRRVDGSIVKMLNIVSQCWAERRHVRIRYWPLNATAAESRIIEPYFIQPSALARAVYVIAYCRLRNELRVFRFDRILEVEALETVYEIPEDFDANEYLSAYWSVTATGTPRVVRLRFRSEIARIATETVWHDSQVTEAQMDGSVVVTMRLAITHDLVSFILGWADMVEVLEPRALQHELARAARKIYEAYREVSSPAGVESPMALVSAPAPSYHASEAVGAFAAATRPMAATQLSLFPDRTPQLE